MSLMGWIANVLLIVSFWLMNNRQRSAFVWSFAGNFLWCVEGVTIGHVALTSVCVVFMCLALHGWCKWGAERNECAH